MIYCSHVVAKFPHLRCCTGCHDAAESGNGSLVELYDSADVYRGLVCCQLAIAGQMLLDPKNDNKGP